jgi:hypothetical protein
MPLILAYGANQGYDKKSFQTSKCEALGQKFRWAIFSSKLWLLTNSLGTLKLFRESGQRVEYAIKLPGTGEAEGPLWIPIDAKFPTEDYERLVEASELGDVEAIEQSAKALEVRLRGAAKDISTKYVHPPHSTDFAILFLPTEGLFAETIRRPGLLDTLQNECRVVVTGPTTLMALLNSLRMGFRTLAIQKRSGEVWQVLGAVKAEFGKCGQILDKVQKKLQEASKTIDEVAVRKRAIDRKLNGVELLTELDAAAVLGLVDKSGLDAEVLFLSTKRAGRLVLSIRHFSQIKLAERGPSLAVVAAGHHGYQRASDLILRRALKGRWCHQIMGNVVAWRPGQTFRDCADCPETVGVHRAIGSISCSGCLNTIGSRT